MSNEKNRELVSLIQAPIGSALLRIEIWDNKEIGQMANEDFDAFLELVQFLKAQNKRRLEQAQQPQPTSEIP